MADKRHTGIMFEEGSGNVFADLGLEDADELYLRARIGFFVFKILGQETLNSGKSQRCLESPSPTYRT